MRDQELIFADLQVLVRDLSFEHRDWPTRQEGLGSPKLKLGQPPNLV